MQTEFDNIWKSLSEQGKCDGIGGAEYNRVRQELIDRMEFFITMRANAVPDFVHNKFPRTADDYEKGRTDGR